MTVLIRQGALLLASALFLSLLACGPKSQAPDSGGSKPNTLANTPPPVPAELWKEFSGDRAFEHVRRQVECGARPSGSPALAKARELILAALKESGWLVELQTFTDATPRGPKTFCNVIARFPESPEKTASPSSPKAIVASHYDTKIFSTIEFVGANDGGSSTGALLELSRTLALDPAFASQFELVFFDGEEAVQQFTETDGLYGSRYYARELRDSGRSKQFRFGILWDMIGDRNLNITLPSDSPREMVQGLLSSSQALSVRQCFGILDRPLLDDHIPLNHVARIPCLDIIDFDYPAWHTADDTLDLLSPASLQTVGSVTLHYLKQLLP